MFASLESKERAHAQNKAEIKAPQKAVIPSVLLQTSEKANDDGVAADDGGWPTVVIGDYPYMCICDELGKCPEDSYADRCYTMDAVSAVLAYVALMLS